MKHECQNCGKTWAEDQLREVKDLFERVAPGEEMPSGECPECGAVCHPVRPEQKFESRLFEAKLALRDLLQEKFDRGGFMPCCEKNVLMELGNDPDVRESEDRKKEVKP